MLIHFRVSVRLQSFVNILQSSTMNFKDYIQGVTGLSRKISPSGHIDGHIFLRYRGYTPVYIYTVKMKVRIPH